MNKPDLPTRRTALRIIAGATVAAALGGNSARAGSAPAAWTWRGTALGGRASITVHDSDRESARAGLERCVAEIGRLESIFSLYRSDSSLARLNRDGHLHSPPPELIEVLALARTLFRHSDGRFDASVQPLWSAHRAHFSAPVEGRGMLAERLAGALELVGFHHLDIREERITLARPGMALTLNGIAQGFVTDRVVRVLKRAGLQVALVDAGEIRGYGDGKRWALGLPASGDEHERFYLDRPRAVATTEARGFVFEDSGSHHHLFNAVDGRSANAYRAVTALAPTAVLADGLSTACAVSDTDAIRTLVGAFDDVQVRLLKADGSVEWIA